eukprot:augustus_masked-scaffold_2-processed-gene-4.47-mRNA-1 protein AED:0.01 eAED:0.01 QI:0/-1/0/1/-1/1/1/0/310
MELKILKEELQDLKTKNEAIQRRIQPLVAKKEVKARDEKKEFFEAGDQEKNLYMKSLDEYFASFEGQTQLVRQLTEKTEKTESRLQEKMRKVTEAAKTFAHFRTEISKTSINPHTKKPINPRQLVNFQKKEQKLAKQIEELWFTNIFVVLQLKKVEDEISSKEQLSEGLHLIDFEQLKIENQTLVEKIEGRAEELQKLKNKTTTMVQVLIHLKEKLQFIQKENEKSQLDLSLGQNELMSSKETLKRMKNQKARQEKRREKNQKENQFACNPTLVEDYKKVVARAEEINKKNILLKERLTTLKRMKKEKMK